MQARPVSSPPLSSPRFWTLLLLAAALVCPGGQLVARGRTPAVRATSRRRPTRRLTCSRTRDGPSRPDNLCGNGVLNLPDESCDDGNQIGGDGCSATCQTETDWICPEPGQPCVSTVKCGDGIVSGAESCDDRNTTSGDGCSADCQLEPGWTCLAVGARCLPVCGDGMLLGSETCDDGNTTPGDGCSDNCRVEPGLRLPDAEHDVPPDGVRRRHQGGRRILRRRQRDRRRWLHRGLPCRAGVPGNHGLHLAVRRRPQAARRGMRRRQHHLGRRLLGRLPPRAQLGLQGGGRRRRRPPDRAGHLP